MNKVCAVILGPTFEDAKEQILSVGQKVDLFELVLDAFTFHDREKLAELMEISKLPCVLNLGQSALPVGLEPDYVDLDLASSEERFEEVRNSFPKAKLLVSFHDFLSTPEDLSSIVAKMKKRRADVCKIAVYANSSMDAWRLLDFLRGCEGSLIIHSMGTYGQFTRILGAIWGNAWSYAAVSEEKKNAPGQMSVNELVDLYRLRELSKETKRFALLSGDISRSVSASIHNTAMHFLALDAVYLKIQVKIEELDQVLQEMSRYAFSGISVTMPLKEVIIPLLLEVDPKAQAIGAVNTLAPKLSSLRGFNTDASGALDALEEIEKVNGKLIVVVGAGGAARAIVYEAKQRGAHVVILNRNLDRGKAIANEFGCESGRLDDLEEWSKRGYNILINTTPNSMPIDSVYILPNAVVMDIVTRPKMTPFLLAAEKRGCRVVTGDKMFVRQAVNQYALWGIPKPGIFDALSQAADRFFLIDPMDTRKLRPSGRG